MTTIKTPKKLIEVALPLDDINVACAYEKMPGIGAHPRGIHLWWARRPLAAARAVIFAQMINDPGYERNLGRGVNKERARVERQRLFRLISELVKWENTNNKALLDEAREEILKSWRETCELNKHHPDAARLFNPNSLPGFHDPFSGGGALPLEAQRLGLEAHAADLNPVAVMINKAMIEIPPKFSNLPPVGPVPNSRKQSKLPEQWSGPEGIAEDVRRYAEWMRDEAFSRIGNFYPEIQLPKDQGGVKSKVIAWLWARTVKSPNPAYSHADVPLASSFVLANKTGKEVYVEPIVSGDQIRFEVRYGKPPAEAKAGTKLARGAKFKCLLSGVPIDPAYIKSEGMAGRIGMRLMAVVAEGKRARVYVSPTDEMEKLAKAANPTWKPNTSLPNDPRNFWTLNYGLSKFGDLFTDRQLLALGTLSDLVAEVRSKVEKDARNAQLPDDDRKLANGGVGASAYAEAVSIYLAFAIDRCTDFVNSLCGWSSTNQKVMHLFGKQSLPMAWDFAEANILVDTVGGYLPAAQYIADCIEKLPLSGGQGFASQANASQSEIAKDMGLPSASITAEYFENIAMPGPITA
ncbi:MAG: DUF1156 domain-containing protein [Alphaproteobacteria bacterium]|nr:DUF1156 domain-containing protein [Alphaproteobacteria bacterium]